MQKRSTIGVLLFTISTIMLTSFKTVPGGDSFKIYLNNKLVIQQHVYERKETARLIVDLASDEQVSVEFNNCGKLNTARKLILKDGENNIVKKWDYPDSRDLKNQISFKVSEVAKLSEKMNNLNLYYSSNELADGLILANINLTQKTARRE